MRRFVQVADKLAGGEHVADAHHAQQRELGDLAGEEGLEPAGVDLIESAKADSSTPWANGPPRRINLLVKKVKPVVTVAA